MQAPGGSKQKNYFTHVPAAPLSPPIYYHHERFPNQLYFQQGPSRAEQTINKYKNGQEHVNPPQQQGAGGNQVKPHVPTRRHPATGLEHPYNPATNYLSKYPLGFRGCFICGSLEHNFAYDCPVKKGGKMDKHQFFAELWTHKPHTKRPPLPPYPFNNDNNKNGRIIFYNQHD